MITTERHIVVILVKIYESKSLVHVHVHVHTVVITFLGLGGILVVAILFAKFDGPAVVPFDLIMFAVLGVCLAITLFTYTGNTTFGDWLPGSALLIASVACGYYFHTGSIKWTVSVTAACLVAYAVIGVVYSIGGWWWETRRRGVMEEIIRRAGGSRDPLTLVKASEGHIIRTMVYWPFALMRQFLLAIIRDFFYWCYDQLINVFVAVIRPLIPA